MVRIAGLAIVLAACLSAAALAQTADEQTACREDFQKFCQGITPGGGRIIACLANHKDKLAPACRKVADTHAK